MGSTDSKPVDVALTGGGAAARAAAFTAPPLVSERVVGLDNCGNTCYCNAVMQALYFCAPLRSRLATLHAVIKGDVAVETVVKADAEELAQDDPETDDEKNEQSTASGAGLASPTMPANLEMPSSPSFGSSLTRPPAPAWSLKDHQETVIAKLCDLFDQLDAVALSGKSKHFNPKVAVAKVKNENVMFKNNLQQDAHEFAIFVLNTIIEEERALLNMKQSKTPTALQRMLTGKTVSKTYCGECDTETCMDQPFLDINIDVVQNTSLRHCTELFSQYETLSGEDKFRCDACTSPVDARRRVLFKYLPEVLLIQLKRFSYNERVGGFTKRNDRVAFAPTMIVQTVKGESRRYLLAGVVVHQGATPHLGHYVALCQSAASRRWYKCDDDLVSPFAERDLQRYFGVSDAIHDANLPSTATAYLLFYTKM
jgi:ubiquitin C-terminal hydrolase